MHHHIPFGTSGRRRGIALLLAVVAVVALLLPAAADDKPGLTADQVRDLQTKFQAEREAAVSSGVAGKFAPAVLQAADQAAKKGDAALAANQLPAAAEAFREARRLLPTLPADFPEAVVRVFGNARFRHGDWIEDLSYTADGNRLATASRDGIVKIWDTATGRELRSLRDLEDRAKTVTAAREQVARSVAVAFRPDGKTLAFAAGKDIKLYDPDSGKITATLTGHTAGITTLAYSADGKTLASGSLDATIRTWDAEEKKLAKLLRTGHRRIVTAVFSPDGKLLAATSVANSGEGIVDVWNHANETKLLANPYYKQGASLSLAYSPDGKSLAHCGINGQPNTSVAPASEGQQPPNAGTTLITFGEKVNNATCVAFSPDGKLLATGGSNLADGDNAVRIWEAATGQSVRVFHGHRGMITALAFHPNGRQITTVSRDQTVRFWQVDPETPPRQLEGHQNFVWAASFSPDGARLVSGSADKTVKIWDVATGKPQRTLEGHKAPVTVALFAPDGKSVLSAAGDETLKQWNADTGEELRTLSGHKAAVMSAAFDKEGKRIVSGAADRLVKLWDAGTGKELHNLEGHQAAVSAVAFLAAGKRVGSGDAQGAIKFWNAETGKETTTFSAHSTGVSSLAFSPDGARLASCGGDGLIKIWTLNGDKEPTLFKQLGTHTGPLSTVAFSADGRFLASAGNDKLVKLWDAQTGNELRSYRGHTNYVSCVAFAPDGQSLVTSSVDKTLRIWDNSGHEVGNTAAGHTQPLNVAIVSPDGKLLATAGEDHTIRLWDAATGAEGHILRGHTRMISALAFSPDSKTLVSGSTDASVRAWDVLTGKELKALESVGSSSAVNFTADGKQLYVWLPYREAHPRTTIRSFDPATWTPRDAVTDPDPKVRCLALSDGDLVAVGTPEGTVRLWTTGKGERYLAGDLMAHPKGLADLIFTADKKTLITGGLDGEIRVWDVEKIRPAGERQPLHTIPGHAGRVSGFAVSPDGKSFVTVGPDDDVKLWDLATGKERAKWDLRVGVRNLAFSPDGKNIVTANTDTTAYLLKVPE